jgi:hypothetical protein
MMGVPAGADISLPAPISSLYSGVPSAFTLKRPPTIGTLEINAGKKNYRAKMSKDRRVPPSSLGFHLHHGLPLRGHELSAGRKNMEMARLILL